jgi:hypothetical protein
VSPSWHNHTGNQRCRPEQIVEPKTLPELVGLVERAEREKVTVHAVGSGHSWSDVALTEGYLVEPGGLRGVVDLDDGTLAVGFTANRLVRVLSGTPLRELNAALDRAGLALPNMGGYDAQTIAGVVSTSTHGSGLNWGPFPDLVRSLDLVASGGRVVRVEPAGGITDPVRFDTVFGGARRLIQDDAKFRAVVCGIGCMGLTYSLVIEVRERFWLNEIRTLDTWEDLRDRLTPDQLLGEGDHYELFLNPYAGIKGKHRVLVTRRADCPEPVDHPPDKLMRHPLIEIQSSWWITGVVLRLLARLFPSKVASRFDDLLADMRDDGYANVSYKVFNIGEANNLPACSMELGVALENGRHIECIDRLLRIASQRRGQDHLVHTSPIALRFVAASRAYASMMHDRPTMMIELILIDGTRGGNELLAGYEQRLADLDVRPHWGQVNWLTAQRVPELYPRWPAWLDTRRELNASGVFDSPFARRVGA